MLPHHIEQPMQSLGLCTLVVACTALWTVSGLKIGAFNVQAFGEKKSNDKRTMKVLSEIVKRYDVLLIQEIRNKEVDVIVKLLEAVSMPQYQYKISRRLGSTSFKEQYAFIYRSDTVDITGDYQYHDDTVAFERPPYSVLISPKDKALPRFFLLGIHVKPDNAFDEINNLHEAFLAVSNYYGTQNGIILGDFNAGCAYLKDDDYKQLELVKDTNFNWLLDQKAYTNLSSAKKRCPYDKIVAHKIILSAVKIENVKVFVFDKVYQLTHDEAMAVSDHYPVEADITYKTARIM